MMNRKTLEDHILKTYGVKAEYPWKEDFENAVFRHRENRKWFALIMTIDREKLGIAQSGKVDVVNLKCDANLVPSMWEQNGIYPAYHMNKEHWISVTLDNNTDKNTLDFLLALSFDLTAKKIKK